MKPLHTTPPLQNLPTKIAHQQQSPPHLHFLKPPHTTPPLQNSIVLLGEIKAYIHALDYKSSALLKTSHPCMLPM
jgi:hypothetical protein